MVAHQRCHMHAGEVNAVCGDATGDRLDRSLHDDNRDVDPSRSLDPMRAHAGLLLDVLDHSDAPLWRIHSLRSLSHAPELGRLGCRAAG